MDKLRFLVLSHLNPAMLVLIHVNENDDDDDDDDQGQPPVRRWKEKVRERKICVGLYWC